MGFLTWGCHKMIDSQEKQNGRLDKRYEPGNYVIVTKHSILQRHKMTDF